MFLLALGMSLTACTADGRPQTADSGQPTAVSHQPSATLTPSATAPPATPTFTLQPSVTPTPLPPAVLSPAPYVPEAVAARAETLLADLPALRSGEIPLDVDGETPVAQWIYALAAPFPTVRGGVTMDEFDRLWAGEPLDDGESPVLLMEAQTLGALTAFRGEPAEGAVETLPPEDLLDAAWERESAWAVVPFEALEPRWKVLKIGGVSPIQKDFDPSGYPLTLIFGLPGEFSASGFPSSLLTNRDPARFTDIMLTGVTALVRGTALTMERKGILYPGESIRDLTRSVDFMHVNNEIPFTPDCPFPELYPKYLVFCSDVRYLDLLLDIGADVVELSGDHFGDHGPEGTLFTLDLYDETGLPYYGGGRNLAQGRAPLLLEHNSNKIAFIGCNAKGSTYYAPADADTPGAVPCDFGYLEEVIPRLKAEGYVVVMTFQHVEYYSYAAQPDLVRDFGRVAAAGADIVSGSQAHQPHGMAFAEGAFIHYGLGNLFFDQYHYCEDYACDNAFLDRHIIYNGRYISTELIPIRFVDMARPRPMTAEERAAFLEVMFAASGWAAADR